MASRLTCCFMDLDGDQELLEKLRAKMFVLCEP